MAPIKFPELYEDVYEEKEPLYQDTFHEADSDGNYGSFAGKVYPRITPNCLYLGGSTIPLVKVLEAKLHGQGVGVLFLNGHNVPQRICFVRVGMFSNKEKVYGKFLDALKGAIEKSASLHSGEELLAYRAQAPEDTCLKCGERGAAPVAFSRVISIAHLVLHKHRASVLCKKHATEEGLRYLFTSWFLGWFGIGALFLPFVQVRNVRSLSRHSTLSRPVIWAAALWPLLILAFIVFSLRSGGNG
jgi:hypothetical protein